MRFPRAPSRRITSIHLEAAGRQPLDNRYLHSGRYEFIYSNFAAYPPTAQPAISNPNFSKGPPHRLSEGQGWALLVADFSTHRYFSHQLGISSYQYVRKSSFFCFLGGDRLNEAGFSLTSSLSRVDDTRRYLRHDSDCSVAKQAASVGMKWGMPFSPWGCQGLFHSGDKPFAESSRHRYIG